MQNHNDMFDKLKKRLVVETMPPSIAKLYNQYTRLKLSQPGMESWTNEEFNLLLNDAVALIDAGLYERENEINSWKETFKKAGEILEWLSIPSLNTEKKPLKLLAAAVYQLAGYPALSIGTLNESIETTNDSKLISSLLKSDFYALNKQLISYWEERTKEQFESHKESTDFSLLIVDETVRILGVLVAYMRWGDKERLEKAFNKFYYLSKIMLNGKDSYSWLISRLCLEVTKEYINMSLRKNSEDFFSDLTPSGRIILKKYLKNSFLDSKALVWPSQIRGIQMLKEDSSFALCTPTGSGKTTIAEIAIIQSLFNNSHISPDRVHPIALYLVPSRALATEVESKMSSVLSNLSEPSINVTGLYGGTDWGPSDAWITSNEPTVLICTYEKGDALLRFLGPLFINRLNLVVIDEAHSVEFNGEYNTLISADNRNLRLETLVNRLLSNKNNHKVIALSAVAGNSNQSLSNWVSGQLESEPIITQYRSTRQLIGRLEWTTTGNFSISYDLLNGNDLSFSEEDFTDTIPCIENPFSNFPIKFDLIPKMFTNKTVGKRQRLHLFWAALQLIKPDSQGQQRSVLISITQHINTYAEDFIYFFEKTLKNFPAIDFFKYPTDEDKITLWEKCLLSCEDYYGKDSNEYSLLKRGIVVHHGNMPGLLSRLLIEVINKRIINLVLATSTLSEGVNLPFETVIIPTIMRSGKTLEITEVKNLIGRAGRPGSSTEGRTLFFLEREPSDWSATNARKIYFDIISQLDLNSSIQLVESKANSPITHLMKYIVEQWRSLTGKKTSKQFFEWLESTIPTDIHQNEDDNNAVIALDTLDGILISLIEENSLEEKDNNKTRAQVEEHLQRVWKYTYSYVINPENDGLNQMFYQRGGAIIENIYPEPSFRRQIYRTSLPPRFAKELINKHSKIIEKMKSGDEYARWSNEQKLNFILDIVSSITELEKFKIPEGVGKGKNFISWQELLVWWLCPEHARVRPNKKQIAQWIKFIKKHFEYLFNWGLGSVISLNMGSDFTKVTLKDWPKTGLPWIIFWLKELIVWGSLDPVVTQLLSHGIDFTRTDASKRSEVYYLTKEKETSNNEILNASNIRRWAKSFQITKKQLKIGNEISATLIKEIKSHKQWRVFPVKTGDKVKWIDSAGFELAQSKAPESLDKWNSQHMDYVLDSRNSIIRVVT